ncbi:MAG: Fur family transcriptional regulator, ferric uptake regulator [Chloroflexota bacterium]|nr:Fur family transcriptional regulator, ferric uptake regulator [Chloroflexota bacterium]
MGTRPDGPARPTVRSIPRRRRRGHGLPPVETVSHLCYDPAMSAPIMTALDRAGYRLTEPRRALAALIADQEGHFTAAELVAAARARRLGVGRATVFRTLELLEVIGAVERIDLPTGEHAYVGCEPAHHHHVVCSRCGRTSEIDDAGLRSVVREVARQTGYRVDEHRLELFGVCPACLAAPSLPLAEPIPGGSS